MLDNLYIVNWSDSRYFNAEVYDNRTAAQERYRSLNAPRILTPKIICFTKTLDTLETLCRAVHMIELFGTDNDQTQYNHKLMYYIAELIKLLPDGKGVWNAELNTQVFWHFRKYLAEYLESYM